MIYLWILLLVGCTQQEVPIGDPTYDVPNLIVPTKWQEDFEIHQDGIIPISIENNLILDQQVPIVYVKDLQDDSDLEHQQFKQSVLEMLEQGRYVWFVGHTSIQELKMLLGISFYETITYLEKKDEYPWIDAFGHLHDVYENVTYTHELEDDLSFDLLIYRQSGEGLMIVSHDGQYADLLCSVYEDFLYHPETIGDLYPMNTQYRLYREGKYYTYSYQIYHDTSMKKYTISMMGYFSDDGKIMTMQLVSKQTSDDHIRFDIHYVRNGDVHQQLIMKYPDQSMRLMAFPTSKISIVEEDIYKMTYEAIRESYQKDHRLEGIVEIQDTDEDIQGFINHYEVKVEGTFK